MQPIDDETPKGRESSGEFARRLMADPLEGPSWLFADDEQQEQPEAGGRLAKEIMARKQRSSSIALKAKVGDCSRKLQLVDDEDHDGRGEKSKKTVQFEEANDTGSTVDVFATPTGPVTPEEDGGSSSARTTPIISSPSHQASSSASTTPMEAGSSTPSTAASTPCPEDEAIGDPRPSLDDDGGAARPRRRAAAAASSSLKEPALNKKMSRGPGVEGVGQKKGAAKGKKKK